ncbi:hypothetical protein TRICI_002556 [Trichomonascus ciferrii]|uniref:Uncharacterized protein n=1 Tax=Trichomonascus ciferrii TaxID=44093 RepID=A0A642V655_9ASCO|nr:hypothetical protein TRICI_002556 [Trichomonascus ciferrii]
MSYANNGEDITRVPTRYRRRPAGRSVSARPKLQLETTRGAAQQHSSSASSTPLSAYTTPLTHTATTDYDDDEDDRPSVDTNPFVETQSRMSSSRMEGSKHLRRAHTHHKSSSETKIEPTRAFDIKIQLPTQSVVKQVSLDTRISDLLEDLVSEHRYELPGSADDFMLWEVVDTFGVKRPLRSYEYIKFIRASWENMSNNYLQVGPSSKKLEVDSIAFLAPRRDLYNGKAFFKGPVSYQKPNFHDWRKGHLDVTNNHLVLRKREHGSDIRSLNLSEFELYEYRKSKLASFRSLPGKYTLILRSQQSPDFFLNKADAVLFLSTNSRDDYDSLRNIVYSLRSQALDKVVRAYAQSLENPQELTSNQKNLLDIHGGQEGTHTHNNQEEESIPLAQLHLDHQEIKKQGLLGTTYEKMVHHQHVNNPNAVETPKFTPNSLLANAKPSAISGTPVPTEDRSPFERGLMGRTYSVKRPSKKPQRLPSHSMATSHKI